MAERTAFCSAPVRICVLELDFDGGEIDDRDRRHVLRASRQVDAGLSIASCSRARMACSRDESGGSLDVTAVAAVSRMIAPRGNSIGRHVRLSARAVAGPL